MLGVASVALWAAGCARPEPAADPISRWELDETSSAEGVFEDRGPAHVLMILAGLWANLTTDPLVAGDDGTSAYTDGAAYATIPANVAAHNLAALTISFYYQRESASDKHVLLAAGDGSEAGDLSIEVLANGRLRAWHTGQDGGLRFFESTGGITGTSLLVGTAHRIDLTLGPQGARIYLDGAELTAAALPANTNGWNNGRVKVLGRWTDGVQAPAVGVFDRLRIWNRQLTGAEIADLEAAQSITLPDEEPGQPEPGEALSVPSLAEWLPSDVADPAPTKYVSGQNRGNGSGSSPAHAQEVQAALDGASPGDVLLAVCQTPGTIEFWDYPTGLDFPNGSAGNYITLQARDGDGVVISAGENFSGARTPNSGFWTQSGLSQADIDKHIWRSVGTFPGAQSMMGMWIEFGYPHQIVRASSMANLRATYGTADSPTNYAGPCVHKDSDNRVYIRFQRPHVGKYSFGSKYSANVWDGHPEAVSNGQIVYPISQNPNDYEIYLFQAATTTRGFNVGSWAKVGAGINSMGHRHAFPNGSSGIWFDRGLHYNWQSFNEATVTGEPIRNCFFHRVRATDGAKVHLSRSEWKFGGWLEGIRSGAFRMFNADTMSDMYFLDCTIGDYHELLVGGAQCKRVRFRNCTFINIFDDGIQLPNSMSQFELGYCHFYNSAWGGFGRGGDDGGPPETIGQFFHHHNIIDHRQERATHWRAQPHPNFIYGQHSPDSPNPLKIYNNLCIFGPDFEQETGLGFAHADQNGTGGNNGATGTANMHETFNNIILRVFLEGTKRYDPLAGATYSDGSGTGQSGWVMGRLIRYSAAESNELFDYNCYWRPAAMTGPFFFGWRRGGNTTPSNYASLAAWHSSAEFDHSKLSGARRGAYAPGFDGNSVDAKPTIPTIDDYPNSRFNYRPSPTSAVTVAASSSLSGANWWSGLGPTWGRDYFPWNDDEMTLAPGAWKGALNPDGSTLPVGVQNP